jgi:hypothetical protein
VISQFFLEKGTKMPTSTKTKSSTTATFTSETATTIAEALNAANTPAKKGAATKRMNAYIAKRVEAGSDATRVESSIRSLCNRLGRGSK